MSDLVRAITKTILEVRDGGMADDETTRFIIAVLASLRANLQPDYSASAGAKAQQEQIEEAVVKARADMRDQCARFVAGKGFELLAQQIRDNHN